MNFKSYLAGLALIFSLTHFSFAGEGMWIPMLLEQLNEQEMMAMGMKISAEDIYSINQSSMKDAVVLFGNNAPYIKNESCPPTEFNTIYNAPISRLLLTQFNNKADSINNELSLLVDGGDTDNLNNDVQNSWPEESMELRAELLAASPYLSDTVMISTAEKENVIPNSILTEVLIANPQSAKSNKVMEAVDERDTLLTQAQYDNVMEGKLVPGAKEKLESRLSAARAKKELATKNLIMAWRQDTIINATDSIVNLLQNEDRLNLKYAILESYLSVGDSINARTTYNVINNNYHLDNNEYANWLNYGTWIDYRIEQFEKGKQITEPDSSQLVSLYQLYNDSDDQLKAMLRNLLKFADTLQYNEPYLVADTSLKSRKVLFRPAANKTNVHELLVYPNPSRNYFVVDFSTEMTRSEHAFIKVYNSEGKEVDQYPVNTSAGFKVIDTRSWKLGFYVVSLNSNTSGNKTAKVLIMR